MFKFCLFAVALFFVPFVSTQPVRAQTVPEDVTQIVHVTLLEGWRRADGTHMAGLAISLAPGWKTYWRAPGDGGIPTTLGWQGSRNLAAARILWPRPEVFRIRGLRSVGYQGDVILPVQLTPRQSGPIELSAQLGLGVCKEVCIPLHLDLAISLPQHGTGRDLHIAEALARRPDHTAGLVAQCTFTQSRDHTELHIKLDAARTGPATEMIVESRDPDIWISEPELRLSGSDWQATARIVAQDDSARNINADSIRITLLGDDHALDIQGCIAP